MRVAQVVVIRQGDRLQSDSLPERVHAARGDIRIGQPVEKIIRRAILLKDHHHVLNFLPKGRRRGWRRNRCSASPTSAGVHEQSGGKQASRSRKNRSEEHTSELQSRLHLVCRLLLENKKLPACN